MYTADTGKAKSAPLLPLDASLDYQAPTIVRDGWYWLIAIYLRTYLHASLHRSCVNRLRTRSARWSSINKRGAATIDCKPPLPTEVYNLCRNKNHHGLRRRDYATGPLFIKILSQDITAQSPQAKFLNRAVPLVSVPISLLFGTGKLCKYYMIA